MSRLDFGGRLDAHLLSGEPGGAGGDGPRFYFEDGHQRCEGCPAILCLEAADACEGGCPAGHQTVAFSYDGLDYCASCADETRATIAEDIARDMFVRRALVAS